MIMTTHPRRPPSNTNQVDWVSGAGPGGPKRNRMASIRLASYYAVNLEQKRRSIQGFDDAQQGKRIWLANLTNKGWRAPEP